MHNNDRIPSENSPSQPRGPETGQKPPDTVHENAIVSRRRFLGLLAAGGAALTGAALVARTALNAYASRIVRYYTSPETDRLTQEVEEHVVPNLQWVTVHEALEEEKKCMDGRCCECGDCLPGGDVADISEKVSTHEKLAKQPCKRSARQVLDAVFESGKKRIYVHTDYKTIGKLAQHFHMSDEAFLNIFRNPPQHMRIEILQIIREKPGCAHLEGIVNNIDHQYDHLKKDFTKDLIEEAYLLWWAGDPRVVIDVFTIKHKEKAVVYFDSEIPLTPDSFVPRAPANIQTGGNKEGHQLFIINAAMEKLLDEQFPAIATRITGLPPVNGEEFARELQINRLKSRAASAKRIADDLHSVRVFFDPLNRQISRIVA